MRGLAATQISPGAETCVIVGGLATPEHIDLRGYRSVLWFTHGAQHDVARFSVDAKNVRFEPVDSADPQRTAATLDALIRRDALHLPSVIVTNEVSGDSAQPFLPVIDAIFAQFESHQRARTTRQKDGFTWQKHLLANLPGYAHRRIPDGWAGALAGLPAIVCGAGPSLDVSIHYLKNFAERGVIFSADSALRALARVGVGADFAVSMDSGKTPEKILVPGFPSAGRMIVAGISPPDWRYSVAEEKLHFISGRQLTEDWLAKLGQKKTPVVAEENCGITALALALHCGCGPIYLFGMDHATDSKDPARWHHRQGPTDADQQIGFSPAHSYPKVPGNFQDEIATPLFREWRALDSRCAALPAGLVFNVTDRGARLRNTTVLRPTAFAIDDAAPDKTGPLETLERPSAVDAQTWKKTRDILEETARRADTAVATARTLLDNGNAPFAVQTLSRAFGDPQISRLFGNYSLKVMPHLLRPDDVDLAVWRQLLEECDELIALVRDLR
jgi:hypothetical protein